MTRCADAERAGYDVSTGSPWLLHATLLAQLASAFPPPAETSDKLKLSQSCTSGFLGLGSSSLIQITKFSNHFGYATSQTVSDAELLQQSAPGRRDREIGLAGGKSLVNFVAAWDQLVRMHT